MIKEEWFQIVLLLKSAYPKDNFIANSYVSKTWYMFFKDFSFEKLKAVVVDYIRLNTFPPTIADINKAYVTYGESDDWSEAWENIVKQIRKHGSYGYQDAMNELNEIERTCVKRMGWRDLCMSENVSVDRGQFRKIYENVINEHKVSNIHKLGVGLLEGERND